MTNAANSNTIYYVDYAIKVDHPELRGPSYPVVAEGKVLSSTITTDNHRAAVNYYNGFLAGEDTFDSEYVKRVAVWAVDLNTNARRCVRKMMLRDSRDGAWYAL